jgi:hypothetical protein
MLVFYSGTWHTVELPFSDPILSAGHLQFAATVVVSEREKGATETEAIAVAERRMYQQVYKGMRY